LTHRSIFTSIFTILTLPKRKFLSIKTYARELADFDSLSFQEVLPDARSSDWFTCIRFKEIEAEHIKEKLRGQGIPAISFYAVKQFSLFSKANKGIPGCGFSF